MSGECVVVFVLFSEKLKTSIEINYSSNKLLEATYVNLLDSELIEKDYTDFEKAYASPCKYILNLHCTGTKNQAILWGSRGAQSEVKRGG